MENNDYKKLYTDDEIFGNYSYASIFVSRGFVISSIVLSGQFFKLSGRTKILVVGAGSGYEIINYLNRGHDVKAIDLYAPDIDRVKAVTHIGSAEDMPFNDKEFYLVHCTEMMEHVPEEITDKVLLECKRVSENYVFTIATRHDKPYDTHINIHPAWWWMKRFEDLGFNIKTAQQAPRLTIPAGKYASNMFWPDGVLIYGEC